MYSVRNSIILSFVACILLLAVIFLPINSYLWSSNLQNTRYVATTGDDFLNDCTNGGSPCATIQRAVDVASSEDEILIAGGVYSDVHLRVAPIGYFGPSSISQIVYITKTATIQGGYNSDFSVWDPTIYTSTLDAQQAGRVIFISGQISPTIDSLHVTGGEATGLGGEFINVGTRDTGGGIYISQAEATVSNCIVEGNTAQTSGFNWSYGGGLHLSEDSSTILANEICNNRVSSAQGGVGGGVSLLRSDATLVDNDIFSNEGSNASWGEGAGISIIFGAPQIRGNTISDNLASEDGNGWGGAMYVSSTEAEIEGNIILHNTASNTGDIFGGGLYIVQGDNNFLNNVVMDNQAYSEGGDVFIHGGVNRLAHNTFARSEPQGNNAILISDWYANETWGEVATVVLENNIVSNHATGVIITGGNTVTMTGVLWHSIPVTLTVSPTATLSISHQYMGDPAFSSDGYHLMSSSKAIDNAVNVGVTTDFDGELRPDGCFADIGADEYISGFNCSRVYLPLLMK